MDEKDTIYSVALAGLLHDIGKFAQRADAPLREIADTQARRDVKYIHALAGYSFVQDFAGALPAEVRQALSGVAYHHAPHSDVDERVRLADFLSAGEREELDGERDDRKVPYLRSIFGRLAGQDLPGYLPLKPLQFRRSVLFPQPRDVQDWKDQYRDEYFRLWEEFERACRPLKEISDPALFLEFLLQRMLEFTWCIPSAYSNAVPDISLYDHSRMTAALAACLTVDRRSGEWCRTAGDDDEVAVLVIGDMAGVQNFIYSLASEGAARTLRGRSFYVQLLTEGVADFILRQLGLPPTNLIYAGGGNFYLLAGVSQQERLKEIRQEVTRRLSVAHKGAVHLTLAWAPLKKADFDRARFPEAWRKLHEEFLLPAKHRPLAALPPEELFAIVGTPAGVGGDRDQSCSICGAERQTGERFQKEEAGAEELRKCELCYSFEELGRALPRATHFLWLQAPIPSLSQLPPVRTWQKGLETFGVRVALVDLRRPLEGPNALPRLDGVTLARVSSFPVSETVDESPLFAALNRIPVVRALRPLAQLAPLDKEGRPPTFDQFARQSRGIRRWGVLRMDVDDLGQLFQRDLTLSRLATLSLSLHLFFEGWLPYLEGEADDLRSRLYLQYAGGDDLFIVGAWEALPRFAQWVRQSFAEYVAGNPKVTISGGISLATARYPLYQAAREAEDAQKAAKNLAGKNAISFLNQAVPWDQFAEARARADELVSWCEKRGAPRALLQTLMEIAAEYDRSRRPNRSGQTQIPFGRWMWISFYQLTRAAALVKDRDVREGIIALRDHLLTSPTLIQTIGLAARWAELLTRKENRRDSETGHG